MQVTFDEKYPFLPMSAFSMYKMLVVNRLSTMLNVSCVFPPLVLYPHDSSGCFGWSGSSDSFAKAQASALNIGAVEPKLLLQSSVVARSIVHGALEKAVGAGGVASPEHEQALLDSVALVLAGKNMLQMSLSNV